MKIQTGIDIIEVNRIQEAIENGKEKFLNRITTTLATAYSAICARLTSIASMLEISSFSWLICGLPSTPMESKLN